MTKLLKGLITIVDILFSVGMSSEMARLVATIKGQIFAAERNA